MGLPRRVRSAGFCLRARIRNLSRTQLKCLPLCSGASPGPSEPVASRPASPAVPARARRAIAAELNFVQPTRDYRRHQASHRGAERAHHRRPAERSRPKRRGRQSRGNADRASSHEVAPRYAALKGKLTPHVDQAAGRVLGLGRPQVLASAHARARLLPREKLAQFGDRVGEGARVWGLLHVAGGGFLIIGYHLVLGLWCNDGLRVMLLLSHAVP
jgi:hypothetical protein